MAIRFPTPAFETRKDVLTYLNALTSEGKMKKRRSFWVYFNRQPPFAGYNLTYVEPVLLRGISPTWKFEFDPICLTGTPCSPAHYLVTDEVGENMSGREWRNAE